MSEIERLNKELLESSEETFNRNEEHRKRSEELKIREDELNERSKNLQVSWIFKEITRVFNKHHLFKHRGPENATKN